MQLIGCKVSAKKGQKISFFCFFSLKETIVVCENFVFCLVVTHLSTIFADKYQDLTMQKMITILGPTASGKTAFAAALAKEMGGEIVSADSRQVYRGMDIGTGKDLADYGDVPYHLINICDAGEKYNLFRYQEDFHKAYSDITSRGIRPILCGGTGLYIESVLKGYSLSPVPQNPELRQELDGKPLGELTQMLVELKWKTGSCMHNQTDVDTAQRAIRAIEIETYNLENPTQERQVPPIDSVIIGVDIDREERRRKITRRLKARLEEGMVDEIQGLIDGGVAPDDLIYYGLEYKFVTEYCIGRLSYDEMFRQLEIAIHQFAKRQMTWFRGMERRGFTIHWIDSLMPAEQKIRAVKGLIGE